MMSQGLAMSELKIISNLRLEIVCFLEFSR